MGRNEPRASRPLWPGVQNSRSGDKDGRSQRGLLADNLAANAADVVEAAHCGGEWASAEVASRAAARSGAGCWLAGAAGPARRLAGGVAFMS
jgi:hypothetical protein